MVGVLGLTTEPGTTQPTTYWIRASYEQIQDTSSQTHAGALAHRSSCHYRRCELVERNGSLQSTQAVLSSTNSASNSGADSSTYAYANTSCHS